MSGGWALPMFWFAYGTTDSFREESHSEKKTGKHWDIGCVQLEDLGPGILWYPWSFDSSCLWSSSRSDSGSSGQQHWCSAELWFATDQLEQNCLKWTGSEMVGDEHGVSLSLGGA